MSPERTEERHPPTEARTLLASQFVHGVPIPQGSTRGFNRGGKIVITHGNAKTKPWRQEIAETFANRAPVTDAAISIGLTFILPRPASLPKKYTEHVSKPDIDKLIRSVLDALTGVVWVDDSQVREVHATKIYTAPMVYPGVDITIWTLPGGKPRGR